MKGQALVRVLAIALVLLLCGWVVSHTRWVEVDVDDDPRGAAATDPFYALRQVLQGAGATLEVRHSLEPLPPADATLLLESAQWDIFPERDARLRAWVEGGGHLVLTGFANHGDVLRWVPIGFGLQRRPKAASAAPSRVASGPAPTASTASAAVGAGDADEDVPVVGKQLPRADERPKPLARLLHARQRGLDCADFSEITSTEPAYEPGRVLRGCTWAGVLRPLDHVAPLWTLSGARGTLALRVPVGRGRVTGVMPALPLDNHALLRADNGLIVAAVLQARPGRAVWIVRDETREPLAHWLWHEARAPLLLALAAIALALWRLAARFGPRAALPPRARRSMGEQVRGTGRFIAATDARALHAATRQAFEDVARTRVEAWSEREDADRIAALADAAAPAHALDRAALQASMNIGGGATPAQILAAIAVLEQARRALLRAAPRP